MSATTNKQTLENLLNSQYKTIKSVHVGTGGFACFIVSVKSKKEAKSVAFDLQLATKKPSKFSAIYEEIDIFDKSGELIDIEVTNKIMYYQISNYFGESWPK